MKRNILLTAGLFLAGLLAACGGEPTTSLLVEPAVEETAREVIAPGETAVDEQGAVSVAVTPVDLSPEASALAFEVAMNTHSVDLSMDLAELATLTTDNGRTVPATLWDAVPGGHHVSGVLTFPAVVEGTAVLEGATGLTLTILISFLVPAVSTVKENKS